MSNIDASSRAPAPRALFLGMTGNFSPPSLLALLESGVEVCAVVLPARDRHNGQPAVRLLEKPAQMRPALPVLHSSLHNSIITIAWKHDIPVWEVTRMSEPDTSNLFSHYRPDFLCVACFSLYIPRAILSIPRPGCLNVHPSLLPANRGPDPLFWTFHEGQHETGVTIHLMDEGLDSGPIVAQEKISVPDGITYAQLEAKCAASGGKLLVQSLWQLFHGTATLTPQDESKSSYRPLPAENDYVVVAAEWEARRVYNFIRGVASSDQPVTLISADKTVQATHALSYSQNDVDSHEGEGIIRVKCLDGWVVIAGSTSTHMMDDTC